jgi:hypothetical protein
MGSHTCCIFCKSDIRYSLPEDNGHDGLVCMASQSSSYYYNNYSNSDVSKWVSFSTVSSLCLTIIIYQLVGNSCIGKLDIEYIITVIDIDECTTNPNICPTGKTCVNTPGSYLCECNTCGNVYSST